MEEPQLQNSSGADESGEVEFKSSAAANLQNPDVPRKTINEQVAKTVIAFLNTGGGTLGIGIAENKTILGISHDPELKSMDLDRYVNWLTTLLITSCADPITAFTKSVARSSTARQSSSLR